MGGGQACRRLPSPVDCEVVVAILVPVHVYLMLTPYLRHALLIIITAQRHKTKAKKTRRRQDRADGEAQERESMKPLIALPCEKTSPKRKEQRRRLAIGQPPP